MHGVVNTIYGANDLRPLHDVPGEIKLVLHGNVNRGARQKCDEDDDW